MKINVTEEDYVSGYKIKQQIKQKNSLRSIFHAAVASINCYYFHSIQCWAMILEKFIQPMILNPDIFRFAYCL